MTETPSPEVFYREDIRLWWPVADKDPNAAWKYVTKRMFDSDHATALCGKRRTVVQAGGYVGLWPRRLAKFFKKVLTFEVMPGCHEACSRNCAEFPNVTVSSLGLGSVQGEELPLRTAGTAGSWRIRDDGTEIAHMTTIDYFELQDCDAIILDIEGHEKAALEGAQETIARCNPVIMVEERWGDLPGYLSSLGYSLRKRIHADAIYARR